MNYDYPTSFSERLLPLDQVGLDIAGDEALDTLSASGLEVVSGIQEANWRDVLAIAGKIGIREYCPNDPIRFGLTDSEENPLPEDEGLAKMDKWLAKNGGRGVFLLQKIGDGVLAGYGWTGEEKNPEISDSDITFAIRIDPDLGIKGVGSPFSSAIVSGSMAIHNARNIGLETWKSNVRAVGAYKKAGAKFIDEGPSSMRSTIDPVTGRIIKDAVVDTRLYARFVRSFPALAEQIEPPLYL